MNVIDPPKISGHTVFCDDIRPEMGGKYSLMGVYQGVMYIHGQFPFTLPKFGLMVKYIERAGESSHPLTIKVFLPGDSDDVPSIAGEISIDELRKIRAASVQASNESDGVKYSSLTTYLFFAPLVLNREGLIRVRAFCGDDVIKMGALKIERAPTSPPAPQESEV
jgi:hypothetical protein